MIELIKELSNLRGISGFEYRINDQIASFFESYADEISIDNMGSVTAIKKCGIDNAPKVMIEAHIDEIGLIVTDILDNGFLLFAPVGGVDNRVLPGLEVVIHGRDDMTGIISAKPVHLRNDEKKSARMKEMMIDTGFCAEEVKKMISIGDSITFPQSVGELLGGQFSGKTLDDRAGVAVLVQVMKNLKKYKLNVDVYAAAAVQEEVGLRGSETSAYRINPNIAIAIDVCHGITPDNAENAFETGTGTVISAGPNLHPKVTQQLLDTAKKYNIKANLDIEGGDTGTDAWAIQVAREGIPTALLSIPLKYMHTSVETLSIDDVSATADLLTFFIADLAKEEEWLCL